MKGYVVLGAFYHINMMGEEEVAAKYIGQSKSFEQAKKILDNYVFRQIADGTYRNVELEEPLINEDYGILYVAGRCDFMGKENLISFQIENLDDM